MINEDFPIVLGLSGGIATGKTSAANMLAPPAQVVTDNPILWTHLYFAIPLYKMATARQKITGEDVFDRQCYEIHDILVDLFKGYITYDELVDAVYEIVNMDCPPEGKPRTFLQEVGTNICRKFDHDCFVKWMNRKIKEEFIRFEQEQDRLEEIHDLTNPDEAFYRKILGVVVSDVRFPNEAEFIKNHPNGVLVKLTARPEIIQERTLNRDGAVPSKTQSSFASETAVDTIPEDWFDSIIDTSDLEPGEKLQKIMYSIKEKLNAQNY